MQATCFEFKYLVQEARISSLREFLAAHLVPDEYTDPSQHNSYEVHNLYFDSPGFTLCRRSQFGLRDRLKLRIRFYDDAPRSPVYVEIKRKTGAAALVKERAMVTREGARQLLNYRHIDAMHLESSRIFGSDRAAFATSCRFRDFCHQVGARGRVYVSYRREAYVCPFGGRVRVTFDRQIFASHYRLRTDLRAPLWRRPIDFDGVVVEVKFCDKLPFWLPIFVSTFNLTRASFAKYPKCVESLMGSVADLCL